MKPSIDLVGPEALLRHGRFVRALARSLLADEHTAEDVAQETWVRYIERPPRSALDPRGWLAAVVRNLASNARRDRDRRGELEIDARLPDRTASPDDDAAQAGVLRSVVDAVLALDEPYRSTVLARYFRGWEPKRIAREGGLPIATVKSRLQRALALLRERLDRAHGGREAWGVALVSLADLGRHGTAAVSTALLKLAVAAVLLAIPGFVVWRTSHGRRTAPAAVADSPTLSAPEREETLVPDKVERTEPAPARAVAAASAKAVKTIRVTGVVRNLPYPELGLAGGPAAGAKIGVALPREAIAPLPKGKLTIDTAADGSFELSFDAVASGTISLTLRVEEDGDYRAAQQLVRIDVDADHRDPVVLARGAHGVLTGIAVDASGRPLAGIRLRPDYDDEHPNVFTTDSSGAFHVPWREHMPSIGAVDAPWTVLSVDPITPIEEGGWEPTRVVLCAGTPLRLRVVDESGEGVPGIYVGVRLSRGELCTRGLQQGNVSAIFRWIAKEGRTDETGSIEFADVWAGHQLQFTVLTEKSESQKDGELVFDAKPGEGEPVILAPGEERTLVARWHGNVRLVGRTLATDGQAIPDASLQVTDAGKKRTESGHDLGIVTSAADGSFETRIRSRTLRGPLRILASEPPSKAATLAGLGYANTPPPSDGAAGTQTVELASAVDGVLRADVVLEPTLSITGHVLDAQGNVVTKVHRNHLWAVPAGTPSVGPNTQDWWRGSRMDESGLFTVFGLLRGEYDVCYSEPYKTDDTFSTFLHCFPSIPAGTQGIDLRLPPRDEVRVRLRIHGDGIDHVDVLQAKLFPRDPAPARKSAPKEARVAGVDGWPIDALVGFSGMAEADDALGAWAHDFYTSTKVADFALPARDAGWYVFGISATASMGRRRWFPQASELRWYGAGDYVIDFDAVPTTTVEGKILADATHEHLGVQLVTEGGSRVPLEDPEPGFVPSYVVETDATGRFVIRHAPVGRFRLRAGNAAALAGGQCRSEMPIETGASGIWGLEIRLR